MPDLKKEANEAIADYRQHLLTIRKAAPPLRIELVPSSNARWLSQQPAKSLVLALADAGFQSAGVFSVKGNKQLLVAGFADERRRVHASVSRTKGRAFLGLTARFANGRKLEASNMPMPVEMPCPEWLVRLRYPGASPEVLLKRFASKLPRERPLPASSKNFRGCAEQEFFRYQAWLAERGGWTRRELATRLKAQRILPRGKQADEFLDHARTSEADRALCNWWRLQGSVPVRLEDVMDKLVIVHDELTIAHLLGAYWGSTGDFLAAIEALLASGTPRMIFRRMVVNRGGLLRKVFEKRTPMQADFYLPRTPVTLASGNRAK